MKKFLKKHFTIFSYSSLLLLLLPLSGMMNSPSEKGVDNVINEFLSKRSRKGSDTSTNSNSSTSSLTITKEDLAIIEEIKAKNKIKDIKDIQNQFNDEESLYLFAFDVGQANFILLKQGKILGIIDAGIETKKELNESVGKILPTIIKGNQVKFVFITHPHSDHFSLLYGISSIRKPYSTEFDGCNFYLAGKEGDWQTHGESKAFIDSIKASQITYLENSLLTLELNDSSFLLRVFDTISKNNIQGKPLPEGQSVPKNKENQLSLIIQVAFAGRTILFTGDAEGEGLGRLFRHFASLKPLKWFASDKKEKDEIDDQMKALKTVVAKDPKDCNIQDLSKDYWDLYDKLAKAHNLKTSLDLYDCFSQENGWNSKWSKTPELKKEKLTQHLVDVSRIRHAFRSSDVIVLPHHGTNTEASQNFLGYFAPLAHSAPKIYIVSSSPFGPHGLPKASILEMAPHYPRVFEHPFLYCRDGLSNRFIQFSTTKKPIFLTGAAPAEFQAVRISKDGEVFIFDPTNQKEPWFQFSKAKELESSNKRTRTEAKEEVNEKPKE